MVDARKEWLTNWMVESKRRKEAGLAEEYLYEKNTRTVTYKDFVNKELVLFSNMDNERSIASAIDGLKPGSRKVIIKIFNLDTDLFYCLIILYLIFVSIGFVYLYQKE